jgi:FkbM family methyltransferase
MDSDRSIPIQHPWHRRVLRTLRFGLERLRSPNGYVEAHAAPFGLRFVGPSADCITRHIYRLGAHEPQITRYLIEHVRIGANDIAVDVGANLGWYSVLLDRLSEDGARIFAFEPDPQTYRLLTENLRANAADAVAASNIALGETPGTATLHRYKASNNGRHTLVEAGRVGVCDVQVPVQTLESFLSEQGLGDARIRLLKIDVEGFEYFVLRGARGVLPRCERVLLEFNIVDHGADLIDLLASTGLTVRAFGAGGLIPMSHAELLRARTQHDLLLTPAGLA